MLWEAFDSVAPASSPFEFPVMSLASPRLRSMKRQFYLTTDRTDDTNLGDRMQLACWRARLALANFFKCLGTLVDRSSGKIVSASRRNQHASRVRYPDSGRYTPKIDKSA